MTHKKPEWLAVRHRQGQDYTYVEEILKTLSLNTVCDKAACPNRMECYNKKTATFMILGNICTRNCVFCNIKFGIAEDVMLDEPENISEAVKKLGLKHVVITSVTRDDLPDGGAKHFVRVIECIRRKTPAVIIEVLVPDFQGDKKSLSLVVQAKPEIINHNIETVPRLYPLIRKSADYKRSLKLLRTAKQLDKKIITKSGIMLGLGEHEEEVIAVLRELDSAGCEIITIGQYLSPSKKHYPVKEYIKPIIFERYKRVGKEMGFRHVASAPLVRSSYNAEDIFRCITNSMKSEKGVNSD